MVKQLALDLELVQIAFEDRDGEGQWFLDRDTGEVLRLDDDVDDDDLRAQIERGDERFLEIPYQGPDAGYRDMADFIGSLDDHRLRALLDVATRGKGAFRRFKDVLQDHPEQRERWFAFQKDCVMRRIRRWLESEDIEPVTPTRGDESSITPGDRDDE